MLNTIHEQFGGDKGPLMTFISFLFGNIFVNIQDISFSVAIIVGLLTIVEKITAIKKNKKK